MKRSYPYTGPGASPSQAQPQQTTPSSKPTPDYSAYGYGANSALMAGTKTPVGLSQEAQQAQWHQQWQQYYAQQAASTTTGQSQQAFAQIRPPQQLQQQQPLVQTQPFAYQQQQQQSQQYYGQQFPQQPSLQPGQQIPNAPFVWPNQQQAITPAFPQQQTQSFVAPPLAQQQPANYHFNNANMPPAKRQRFEPGVQQQNVVMAMRPVVALSHQNGSPGYQAGGGGPAGPQAFLGANNVAAGGPLNGHGWQNGSQNARPGRMSPMRGGGIPAHSGGPSNMAGPMAAPPPGIRTPSMPRGPSRPGRPQMQPMPNRPMIPSAGKFNGPIGVNAMTMQGRGGFGRAGPSSGPGTRRPIVGLRNGVPSGPSVKGNRLDQNKGNAIIKSAVKKGSGENNRTTSSSSRVDPPSSKRTFSDFRIEAISIDPIDWHWQQGDDNEDEEEEEAGDEEDETLQSSNIEVESANGSIQGTRKAKSGKRKEKFEVSREISRLRICFAANLPPPGAPTGPKALTKVTEKEEAEQIVAAEIVSNADEPEWTAFSRGPPQSSINRISISYASSKRRLVIDSDVIKFIKINRAERTLKIIVDVKTAAGIKRRDQMEKKKGEEWVIVKGVLLEGREAEMDNFSAISRRELEKCWTMKGEVEGEEVEAAAEAEEVVEADEECAQSDEQMGNENVGNDTAVVKTEEGDHEESAGTRGGDEEENAEQSAGENQMKEEEEEEESESESLMVEAAEEEDLTTCEAKAEEVEADVEDEEQEVVWQDYTSLPPFFRLLARHDGPDEDENHSAANSTEMIITVKFAEVSPKQELRWLKTGDVEEWLSALPGFQSSFASASGLKVVHAWTDKIRVDDPDPPPSFPDVLQDWVTKSFVGSNGERKRFLEMHQLQNIAGMTNLICKFVRGERAIPTPNARELGLPLRLAMEGNVFQQNHLTCSIMAIVGLLQEYAGRAGVEDKEAEVRLQEILMCIPSHQIFRGCDGLLKEHLEKQRLSSAAGKSKAIAALPAGPAKKQNAGAEGASAEADAKAKEKGKDEEGKDSKGKSKGNDKDKGKDENNAGKVEKKFVEDQGEDGKGADSNDSIVSEVEVEAEREKEEVGSIAQVKVEEDSSPDIAEVASSGPSSSVVVEDAS